MSDAREQAHSSPIPGLVVGPAIQRLAAARLGRGFFPLGVLFLVGLGEMVDTRSGGAGPLVLAFGAPVSAAAMLAYGLGVVQRAFGHAPRAWWPLATAGGFVPLAFGLYVLGWLGLRGIARWNSASSVATGVAFGALGVWTLRSWQRLSELERLAAVMTLGGRPDLDGTAERKDEGSEEEDS